MLLLVLYKLLGGNMNKYLFRYRRVFTYNLELLYEIDGKTYSTIFEDSIGAKNGYLFWKGSFNGPVDKDFFLSLWEWLGQQGMKYRIHDGKGV